MKKSRLYEKDVKRLEDFRKAYWNFANYEPSETAASDERVGRLLYAEAVGKAAERAGGAAAAFSRHGGKRVDPTMFWEASKSKGSAVTQEGILVSISHAVGAAESAAEEARRLERSFTGKVAAFVQWPQALREATGGGPGRQRTATAVGVFGQVIAGLIVAGVVAVVPFLLASLT